MVEILRSTSSGLYRFAGRYIPEDAQEAKYILRSNFITLFVFSLVLVFIPIFLWIDAPLQVFSAFGVALCGWIVLWLNKGSSRPLGRLFQLLSLACWLFYYSWSFGEESAAHYLYLAFAVIPMILFPVNRSLIYISTFLVYLGLFWLVESSYTSFHGDLSLHDQKVLKAIVYNLLFVWIFVNFWLYNRSNEIYESNIKRTLERLEEKNREMEQFVHIASHDLQEPLKTIRSFVEFFQEDDTSEEERALYLQKIDQASQKMHGLIKALMNHSRMGNPQNVQSLLDLNELLGEIKEDVVDRLGLDKVQLEIGELPMIKANKEDIKTLFEQLIWNAIKFTPGSRIPKIVVRASNQGLYHQFEVDDNGIGIHGPNTNRVFEIFQRLNDSEEYSGLGAGLAHAKKIVQNYDGDIGFKPKEGEGTVFYFTLLAKR